MKKKILILCEYFPPAEKAGGPLRTLEAIASTLGESYNVFVVAKGFDFLSTEPLKDVRLNSWNVKSRYQVYYTDRNAMSFRLYLEIYKAIAPDLIYLNSFFSPRFAFLPLLSSLIFRTRFLCSPRGELSTEALAIKSFRKRAFLFFTKPLWRSRFKFVASSDRESSDIEKRLDIGSEQCIVLSEPTLKRFYEVLPSDKKIGFLNVVFLARLNPIKNLKFAINCIKECGQATMNIYGPINSAEEQRYWKECQDIIFENNLNDRIQYRGQIDNNDVNAMISKHDLLFAPSSSENFGHTILESLTAGRPVLIGDQTPWSAVTKLNAGFAFPIGDQQAFVTALHYYSSLDSGAFNIVCANAHMAAQTLYSNSAASSSWLAFLNQDFLKSSKKDRLDTDLQSS